MEKDASWICGRCVALRFEGIDGWQIGLCAGTAEKARQGAALDGAPAVEVREIARFGGNRGAQGGDALPAMMAASAGWMYDALAECWRAPGEACSRPCGSAERTDRVVWEIGRPLHGWISIRIATGGSAAEISGSYVFDPFENLVVWLEAIAAGRDASVSIDEEGRSHDLHAFGLDAEPNRVRLHVIRHRSESELAVDASVPRSALLSSVYSALRRLDSLPSEDRRGWGLDGEELIVRRSAVVERVLAQADPAATIS